MFLVHRLHVYRRAGSNVTANGDLSHSLSYPVGVLAFFMPGVKEAGTWTWPLSQSKILQMIVDAPWYGSNATLHADLGISSVQDVIQQRSNKHHNKTKTHENPLLKTLLAREDNTRLKKKQNNWPDLRYRGFATGRHLIMPLRFITLAYRMYILIAD
jgi:hypothetical protein